MPIVSLAALKEYFLNARAPQYSQYEDLIDTLASLGGGDMFKSTYDTNNNGVVDNSEKLDGRLAGSSASQIPINNGYLMNDLNADQLDSLHAGNNNGDIPINNGGLNTNLNADLLDYRNATDLAWSGSAASTNFNSCTQSGMYRIGGSYSNGPPNGVYFGQLNVWHGAGDTIFQMATDYLGKELWMRNGNPSDVGGGGSWSAWSKLWHNNQRMGSSNPADYATGEPFFRTDQGMWVYWNGAYWLTVHEYPFQFRHITASANYWYPGIPPQPDYAPFWTRIKWNARVNTLNNPSNYWGITCRALDLNLTTADNLMGINTAAWTAGTWYTNTVYPWRIATAVPTNWVDWVLTTAGSPGAINFAATVYCRLIVT